MSLRMNVVPVGLSLLANVGRNARLAAVDGVLDPAVMDATTNPDRRVHVELEHATDPGTRMLDLNRVFTEPDVWSAIDGALPKDCAEWTSLHVPDQLGGGDGQASVFIASDTNDGLRAAALVAAHHAPGRAVRYVSEPTAALDRQIQAGEVTICRIPGLDLASTDISDSTWFSLGAVGHVIQRTAVDADAGHWDVVVHLAGGYKAMLPYVLVMAEGIKSVFQDHAEVTDPLPTIRAVAVHESNQDTHIEVPISWITPSRRRDLLSLKRFVGDGSVVSSSNWNDWVGQWLETAASPRRLSRAGMILVRVQ